MIALDSLTERGSNMSRDSKQRPIALFSLTANSIDSNSTKVWIVTAMGCNVPTESFLMHTYDSRKPATRRQATWRFGTYRSEEIFHVFFKCHYIGLRVLDMLVNMYETCTAQWRVVQLIIFTCDRSRADRYRCIRIAMRYEWGPNGYIVYMWQAVRVLIILVVLSNTLPRSFLVAELPIRSRPREYIPRFHFNVRIRATLFAVAIVDHWSFLIHKVRSSSFLIMKPW